MKKDLNILNKIDKSIERLDSSILRTTARERLRLLFDNEEYKELFRYARNSSKDDFKDGIVCSFGNVKGRSVVAYATEASFQGGSIGVRESKQIVELYRLARQSGIPVVSLVESGGARISDGVHIQEGLAEVMKETAYNSGVIPQITGTFGYCIGAAAIIASMTDFIVMEKNSSMCISGSVVNKAATGENFSEFELGGPEIHTKYSGNIHFVEDGEVSVINKIKDLLDFLPSNNSEKPPVIECSDPYDRSEDSIEEIIPDSDTKPFDIKKIIKLTVDNKKFLEVQSDFAPNLVIGFARFNGMPVGIAANQSLHMAGAFDCKGFRKMARFLNFLSAFNFPLITFVDVPGAIPTQNEHKEGILAHTSQLVFALANLKSLKISIVVRRCFGGTYAMLNPKIGSGDIIYAYPSAMIGVMSNKAMASVLGKKNSKVLDKIREMDLKGERFDSPYIPAEFGYIDDIIQPKDTRKEIITALKAFSNKRFLDIPPKWMSNQPL